MVQKLLCKIGYHNWSNWKAVCPDKLPANFIHRQCKECDVIITYKDAKLHKKNLG